MQVKPPASKKVTNPDTLTRLAGFFIVNVSYKKYAKMSVKFLFHLSFCYMFVSDKPAREGLDSRTN